MGILWDALFKSSCRCPPGRTTRVVSGLQLERHQGSTYIVAVQLLLLVKLRVQLVDARAVVGGVTAERDVQVLQERVAARKEGLRLVGMGIDTRLAVEDDDTVGEIGGHDEIVLDDEGRLLGVHDEPLNDAAGNNTLLGIEICARVSRTNGKGRMPRLEGSLHADGSSMR